MSTIQSHQHTQVLLSTRCSEKLHVTVKLQKVTENKQQREKERKKQTNRQVRTLIIIVFKLRLWDLFLLQTMGHYLRWQDWLYLNYILKISKYEIDMRGKGKNAQYILKETHTAMIMTWEPSVPPGITPQESCVERAYLSMHKQQQQTNKWMTKPYWYYTFVNEPTIMHTLNAFALMSDHYREVTGIYYLHLSNPVTIIMFIMFNWSSMLSVLTWLCCCTGVFLPWVVTCYCWNLPTNEYY